MGTTAHVVVTNGDEHLLDEAEDFLRACEARWSRFLPTSELTRLNRFAGSLTIVTPETFDLVALAVDAWHLTAGAFDPTVHDALCGLGYDRDFGSLTWVREVGPAAPTPGCRDIELLAECRGVRMPYGVHLDLGGIAKGHAADLLVARLLARGAAGACVNLGGDVRVDGRAPDGHPWVIELDLGVGPAPELRVALAAGGVCTSSRRRRSWCAGSNVVHHLIDPRTGRSVDEGLASVSVIARHAAQAEVLTKAVFLAGPDEGQVLLDELGVAGVLVRDDDSLIEVGNVRELAA
jgi:thiamine biosynthesis lipoprotein